MRANLLLVAVLVLAGAAAGGCAPPRGPVLRVVTWNIAHGRGLAESQAGLPRAEFEHNLAEIASALRTWQPDVVALQESDGPSLWSGGFDHVQKLADRSGLPHHFRGAHITASIGGWGLNCGTALLANRPLHAPRSVAFPTEPIASKGFVWAEVEWAGRTVTIVSVHLHPNSPAMRVRQAELLVKTLAAARRPLIVLGDLNCGPQEPAFRTIIAGLNLRAHLSDRSGLATFPSGEPRIHIDWILLSPEIAWARYELACTPHSDHCAVIADIVQR